MASVNHNTPREKRMGDPSEERKASGLDARASGDSTKSGQGAKRKSDARRSGWKDVSGETGRRRAPIWVDILLILLLVALVTGGVLGYRFLKRAYAPEWEEREVVFLVELTRVDEETMPKYWNMNAPVYLSDRADTQPIARLIGVPYIASLPALSEDESAEAGDALSYKTIHLTLRATALYRAGNGYYIGEMPLWAGTKQDLRVDGLSTSAMILSVYEAAEYDARTAADAAGQ